MNDVRADIQQLWLHSHEDDSETARVYRPSSFSFPPSRGRSGFDLRAGGSYVDMGIASGDGTEARQGTWSFESDVLTLICDAHEGGRHSLRVLSCSPEKLVVEK